MSNTKRRGAPKGRRPVIYICAAVVNGQLAFEEIPVSDQTPDNEASGSFPVEIAMAKFREMHGIDPEKVTSNSKRKAKKTTASRKRLTIDRDSIDQYILSDERKTAQYGSWIGMVNLCTNDEDKAFFIPLSKADPNDDKKSNPPGAGIVNVEDLVFQEENDSPTAIA